MTHISRKGVIYLNYLSVHALTSSNTTMHLGNTHYVVLRNYTASEKHASLSNKHISTYGSYHTPVTIVIRLVIAYTHSKTIYLYNIQKAKYE